MKSNSGIEKKSTPEKIDVLIIAGNARSLIANRGDLTKTLRERKLTVAALVPQADYLPEVEELEIPIYEIDLKRTGTNPLDDIRAAIEIFTLLRTLKPKSVFSYTIKPVIYGTIAAAIADVPRRYVMITGLGHTYTTKTLKTRLLKKLTDLLYRVALNRANTVFFQNPDDEEEFWRSRVLCDKSKAVRVNGSGVNLSRFRPRPLPEGAPNFLFIGRILTEKGIREFVTAATELKAKWPEAQFTVVGGHDATLPHSVPEPELEKWKSGGIVNFTGAVKDVRPALEQCSVFVLPSYREGTPRSVLEAMATERAIITTDAPGCRETVENGFNGFLVPPRNSEELTRAMEQYLLNPNLIEEHAMASLSIVKEKYDVKSVNEVILKAMGYSK